MWSKTMRFLRTSYFPIVSDARPASWSNWREALKEVFVTMTFSLMPLWLGLISILILTITDGPSSFVTKFASRAELAIVATSLLGPLLYMMFREEGATPGNWLVPRFPGGLWFIMIIVACCVIATIMYSFTYLSETAAFFDKAGNPIHFIAGDTVAWLSWVLFAIVTLLTLFACTIRNFIDTRAPRIMSEDTEAFVDEVQADQQPATDSGAQDLADQMQAMRPQT